ncbi:MAG: hypothetical protein ACREMB_25740 [Candidatus Rokuibacteriota bacterium]
MGLEVVVPRRDACRLQPVLDALATAGLPATIAMVDSTLRAPTAPPPEEWRDVRLRTPAGMVALARRPDGVAVIVFGNADAVLQDAQRRIADALRAAP